MRSSSVQETPERYSARSSNELALEVHVSLCVLAIDPRPDEEEGIERGPLKSFLVEVSLISCGPWAAQTLVSNRQTDAKTGANSSEVAMKKQASIRTILLMALVVLAGTLTAQCALFNRQTAPDARGFKEFHDRVEEYEKLHKDAEKGLPKLKKKDDPEAIAARQQALVNKIRELRSNARQGDIFTPSATEAITRTIKAVFTGPGAREVRRTIQAGEPLKGFEVQVNQRDPDS